MTNFIRNEATLWRGATWAANKHEMLDKLDKLLGTAYRHEAKKGPWTITIIRGQRSGAKTVMWRVESGAIMLGKFNNERFATEAIEALNEANALYCMLRGTPIEKEYFP